MGSAWLFRLSRSRAFPCSDQRAGEACPRASQQRELGCFSLPWRSISDLASSAPLSSTILGGYFCLSHFHFNLGRPEAGSCAVSLDRGAFPLALISGSGLARSEAPERRFLAFVNVLPDPGHEPHSNRSCGHGRGRQSFFDRRDPHSGDRAQASSVVVVLSVVYRLEGPFSVRAFFDRREARALLGYGGWISLSRTSQAPSRSQLRSDSIVGSSWSVAAVAIMPSR